MPLIYNSVPELILTNQKPRPTHCWGLDTILSFVESQVGLSNPNVTMLLHTPTYQVYPSVLDLLLLVQSSTLNYDPFGQSPNSSPGSQQHFSILFCTSKLRLGGDLNKENLETYDPVLTLSASMAWRQFPSYKVTSLEYQHGSEPTVLQ